MPYGLILLFPFLGFLVNALIGHRIERRLVGWIASAVVLASFITAINAFIMLLREPSRLIIEKLFDWMILGSLKVSLALQIDPLSILMMLVVSGVGFLIHVYSIGYMHGDRDYSRYFAYLNLFAFSMLLLVAAANFVVLFLGWELVGLCSYLLIGHWFERKSAADAARKAFIVTRIGDCGFMVGLFLIFSVFGTFDFQEVFAAAPEKLAVGGTLATVITLLLFCGAVGKSAQIPLHVWLPDAMEGPTPVSALIHAATMVTAGVYMVARTHALYELAPISQNVVALVGAITALFAASIAIMQNDIKRILAYSTISQLGYMFVAVGIGAFSAGMFHLTTHAFFKALLFLAVGSVIHALHGEQDLRKMGGLYTSLRTTAILLMIGAAAIAGVPPLAGFFSKDLILVGAHSVGASLPLSLIILAALFTVLYMTRLVTIVFFRPPQERNPLLERAHESPKVMLWPMAALALLSALGGLLGISIGGSVWLLDFLGPAYALKEHPTAESEALMMALSIGLVLLGLLIMGMLYFRWPQMRQKLKEHLSLIYKALLNKYYVDELYHWLLVRPGQKLAGSLATAFDLRLLDKLINGIGEFFLKSSELLRRAQSGYVRTYALLFLLGAIGVLLYWIFK